MTVPQKELDQLSPTVRTYFLHWADFLYNRVKFNRPESEIHAEGHCERVLLYALILGEKIFGDDDRALTALAEAAVFHDTRRQDDYLDTGHGARAAEYYKQFCEENPDVAYLPEAALMMRYHDIEDKRGKVGIKLDYNGSLPRMFKLYDIFKDADALDRWRLGAKGFDTRYLRTEPAKEMTQYSKRIVEETVPRELLKRVSDEVERTIAGHEKTATDR